MSKMGLETFPASMLLLEINVLANNNENKKLRITGLSCEELADSPFKKGL